MTTMDEILRALEVLMPWKAEDYFDLEDERVADNRKVLSDGFRLRYATLELAELGALLLRVQDLMRTRKAELLHPSAAMLRPIILEDLFRLDTERVALGGLIDEYRLPSRLLRRGDRLSEIRDAIGKLADRTFASRADMLRAIDEVRGAGDGVTYQYLRRHFGKTLPHDVDRFCEWIRQMASEEASA